MSVVFLLLALIADPPPLRWGGDAEGGAPFVEADPRDPTKVRGFDVEVAGEIAKGLGRRPEFVQVAFQEIDQSVERGDFDLGMSGVEDIPARRAAHAATIPYYEFHEVLTVRDDDRNRFRTMADLRGHRVGTLGGTMAYDFLKTQPVILISYDDDVHPYSDLVQGRLDAVLLDNIIAARRMRSIGGLFMQPQPVATGHYIAVLARTNAALRDRANAVLKARMRDGTLERIYRNWGIWDEYQAAFFASVLSVEAGAPARPRAAGESPATTQSTIVAYIPALLRAALITIVLSCAAMALAIIVGIGIASGRVHGNVLLRSILTTYV